MGAGLRAELALATANDGSCKLGGCMLPAAVNLNATAELDDATCVPGITGCTDPTALHYSSAATIDDGSCIPTVVGCMWPDSHNYNPAAPRGDQRLCSDGLTKEIVDARILESVEESGGPDEAVMGLLRAALDLMEERERKRRSSMVGRRDSSLPSASQLPARARRYTPQTPAAQRRRRYKSRARRAKTATAAPWPAVRSSPRAT